MNRKIVFRMLGFVLLIEAVFLLVPTAVSFYYGEMDSVRAFAVTILLVAVAGGALVWKKPDNTVMYAREGFLIVSFAWILLSLFGALPFVLSGAIPSYVDALFETVSGFTTTGASILSDVEALPKGILFWRSFTHWIGGMGVLVFMLAVLPMSNQRTMHVMRAEVPGPTVGKLVPKMKQTAILLYVIYSIMTVALIVLLVFGRMPLFDSILTAFGTAGTGGFGVKNNSIAYYDSAYIEVVVGIFMLLFGVNFNVYFLLMMKQFRQALKCEEMRWYGCIALAATLLIACNVWPQSESFGDALLDSFFQVSSIITTTGFSTVDFNLWPTFSKIVVFLLMILGACGGSTGGGMKISRLMVVCKKIRYDVVKMIHPRFVRSIRMEGKPLEEKQVSRVQIFCLFYFLIILSMTLLVSLDGFDFETTLTAVVSCISNIGPGLGEVGPMGNFGAFSDGVKLLLSLTMLLGRLEIFPLVLICMPGLYTHSYKNESGRIKNAAD